MKTQNRAWHVRGSLDLPGSKIRKVFLDDNMIAVGWTNFEDMSDLKSLESIKERLRNDTANTHYATHPRSLGIAAAAINRFINIMSVGDYIVFPDGKDIYIGKVASYYPSKKIFKDATHKDYTHCRDVNWLLEKKPILRIDLTESLQSQLRYPRVIKEYNYDDIHEIVTSNS